MWLSTSMSILCTSSNQVETCAKHVTKNLCTHMGPTRLHVASFPCQAISIIELKTHNDVIPPMMAELSAPHSYDLALQPFRGLEIHLRHFPFMLYLHTHTQTWVCLLQYVLKIHIPKLLWMADIKIKIRRGHVLPFYWRWPFYLYLNHDEQLNCNPNPDRVTWTYSEIVAVNFCIKERKEFDSNNCGTKCSAWGKSEGMRFDIDMWVPFNWNESNNEKNVW